VGDELGFETEISEMLLDFSTNKGAQETKTLGLARINFENFL
jgi:hypothetical protein